MTLRKMIATGLAKARNARGLSQSDLARMAGMMPSAIAHFEAGRRSPNCDNLLKLADALEVSLDDLFGRTAGQSKWIGTPAAASIAKSLKKMKASDQKTIAQLASLIVEGKRIGKSAGSVVDD
jgi:transcriptional regulator with XRE-family HTH domain